MSSMRSPRSTPLEIVSRNDTHLPRGEALQGHAADQPPAWDNHFYIAPNVRFTRTPDRMLRKTTDEVKPEPAPQASLVTSGAAPNIPARTMIPVAPVQDVPIEPLVAAAAPEGVSHVVAVANGDAAPSVPLRQVASTVVTPASPAAPANPTRVYPQVQPVVQAAEPVAPAAVEEVKPSATEPVNIVPSDNQLSYLSDFAFFELGAPTLVVPEAEPNAIATEDVCKPVEVVTEKPAHVAQVVPMQPVDIASLYRVIECAVAERSFAGETEPQTESSPVAQPEPEVEVAAARHEEASSSTPKQPQALSSVVTPLRAPSLPLAGAVSAANFGGDYEFPTPEFLQLPPEGQGFYMSQERLEQNADLLETVLQDFGVRGEIINVNPGPVVTLYEFEPAPGVKSSRVIGLTEDIARSMSAISARVAVIPGRNVIGIELPNESRETVYFRELIESEGYKDSSYKLALCLGKTIGGEPVIAELAKMPHLLVAGTTGSGKSVAINTMILSLLYRLKPEECRLIMVDPKMLELSVYDGIPHLLTPVVTDPKKAVTALKWAVREMEDRYRKMARLGVRNIDGFNQRAAIARDKGEVVTMQVQTGFEKGTGEPLYEDQEIDLTPMPYIVVIVDEMADLMMVAGKEIEGAIQRLAQMARAAGIHLIMATQRPSVDVITGTIKANFPTRISFQVTSKIDSRTILGEQGAEQLLGQGDMLHTAGGGRISRVHGPFVSDEEVERVVAHLKLQGRPEYLDTVTADEEDEVEEVDDAPVFDKSALASEDNPDAMFEEAVKIVLRDKKCSTSYIQRRLGIGYNRAASLVERMEQEGLVGAPNHVGKREILAGRG